MEEIELKLKYNEKEKNKIIDFCEKNDYVFTGISEQKDIYLTPAHRNIIENDEAVRIRYEKSTANSNMYALTYKGKGKSTIYHDREELEIAISDGQVLLDILERLDFKTVLKVEKRRETYESDKFTICIDHVKGLGTYLEIEYLSQGDDENIENIKEEMKSEIEKMTLNDSYFESNNYLYLLMIQKKRGTL